MKRPLLIIFEGVDKSGKSTLINEFNKDTNFSFVVIDRLTISSKVYDELFSRNNYDYYDNVEMEIAKNFNVLIVYCDAPNNIIEERLMKANEKLPKELSDIKKVKDVFNHYLYHHCSFLNIVNVDTTKDISECLEAIKRKLYCMGVLKNE